MDRLGCIQSFARGRNGEFFGGGAGACHHVIPYLKGFLHRYLDLQLDLSTSDRFVDFLEEGIDLAMRIQFMLSIAEDVLFPPRYVVSSNISQMNLSLILGCRTDN